MSLIWIFIFLFILYYVPEYWGLVMSPIMLVFIMHYMVKRRRWMRMMEERARDVELGLLQGDCGYVDEEEEQVEERGRIRTRV